MNHSSSSLPDNQTDNQNQPKTRLTRFLQRIVQCQPHEIGPLLLSGAYSFLVLFSYYLIRPIRESLGTQKDLSRKMPYLMTTVLIVMVLANPIYGYLASHFSRRKFISWVYHFFSLNLIGFFVVLFFTQEGSAVYIFTARIFFIWVTVFNLFVVSILWDLMTDVFDVEQGKRLFGFIFATGSIGGALGSLSADFCTKYLSPLVLLLLSMFALQIAILCITKISLASSKKIVVSQEIENIKATKPPGKSTFSGLWAILISPYLLAICGYILLHTFSGTLLYLKQNQIGNEQFSSLAQATSYFSRADFFTNLFASLLQVFVAGRVIARLGVGKTLALLPLITIFSFAFLWFSPKTSHHSFFTWLGWSPTLVWFMLIQVLTRATEFSLAKPARKVLFTVLSRDEKYSSQSITDTFVPRVGDAMAAWGKTIFQKQGFDVIIAGLYATPLWLAWVFLSLYLGKKQASRAALIQKSKLA